MPIRYSSVVGGSSSSGFNLDVGSSGNTTFVFSEAQPAGGYSITSQLADATIEFYAIAEDGSLSGYTNTKALTATKAFNKLVVYGATNNDLISFEFKTTTLPTSIGQENSGAAPFITSVSDADLANIDDTTIIAGGNFATDVAVTFTGTDNVVRNAKSVVRTDSTQLIVTRPDDFLEDYQPYTMTVSNPGIPNPTIVSFTETVTAGSDPVWSTSAGSLGSFQQDSAMSVFLAATDADGDISYSIISGSLPAGLFLNSATGEISGTPTIIEEPSFSVLVTDSGGNTSSRTFSINIISGVIATGGTVQDASGYRYHTFTGSGTFSVSRGGTIEALIVAGGGGGGSDVSGGGGAGGLVLHATSVSVGSYTVEVGAGGSGSNNLSGGPSTPSNGQNSTFTGATTAIGGGHGGLYNNSGATGGSGGGGGGNSGPAGTGTPGQGNDGSYGLSISPNYAAGAGGGAGSAGFVPVGATGGVGGTGLEYAAFANATNTGDSGYYAGGGGGGGTTGGAGGLGGGGRGHNRSSNTAAESGQSNTGGGGGGTGGWSSTGPASGNGGSGIVIVRYQI